MKVLIVLCAALAVSVARPGYINAGVYPYLAGVSTQHHAQDALGQYSYGYSGGPSAKQEVKSFDGVTRGGYSYIDANGIVQSVSYTADAVNGFRVAATNLPKAPVAADAAIPAAQVQDTVEVAAAKIAHSAAINEARARVGAGPEPSPAGPQGLPQPVQETPEVAAARASHAAAHAFAAARAVYAPGVVSVVPSGAFAYSSVAGVPGLGYSSLVAAPVVLTAQGVPVDTPEVQAAKAANAAAHLRAKVALLG